MPPLSAAAAPAPPRLAALASLAAEAAASRSRASPARPRCYSTAPSKDRAARAGRQARPARPTREQMPAWSRFSREFQPGMWYETRDLNEVYNKQYEALQKFLPRQDPFILLGIDPLNEWKNPRIFAPFLTEMGLIKPMEETKLSPATQWRLSRAIQRGRVTGILPINHKPILEEDSTASHGSVVSPLAGQFMPKKI